MTTIKVGIKINLEMKPVIISANTIHKRILKMNFYEVDKIKTLDYINSVIVYDDDIKYINLITKFCKVTNKPLKICLTSELPEKIIHKINKYNIKYIVINI
jgi:hypothetical protein